MAGSPDVRRRGFCHPSEIHRKSRYGVNQIYKILCVLATSHGIILTFPIAWLTHERTPPLLADTFPALLRDHPNVEVPSFAVDMDSRAKPACYPRSSFCLVIFRRSSKNGRFTMSHFRDCSAYMPCSKAGLWHYPISAISIRA